MSEVNGKTKDGQAACDTQRVPSLTTIAHLEHQMSVLREQIAGDDSVIETLVTDLAHRHERRAAARKELGALYRDLEIFKR